MELKATIGQDVTLRRMGATGGGEWAGPCPFCRDGRDRFRVWPCSTRHGGKGRWWCRRCGAKGDAIDYVRRRDGVGFVDACRTLGVPLTGKPARREPVRQTPAVGEPTDAWRERAEAFVAECVDALHDHEGAPWRDYLHKRGISTPAMREARLGLNRRERREKRTSWGMDGDGDVWLPRGITIPATVAPGALLGLRIRRADGDPKYVNVPGGCNALYGAYRLSAALPAILVEGAFDALAIDQAAGDLVTAVATLSTTGARRVKWVARIAVAPVLLLSFDADDGGRTATTYWRGMFPMARVWPPTAGDPSDMWAASGDVGVRRWVADGLGREIDDDTTETDCERIAMRLEG